MSLPTNNTGEGLDLTHPDAGRTLWQVYKLLLSATQDGESGYEQTGERTAKHGLARVAESCTDSHQPKYEGERDEPADNEKARCWSSEPSTK